MTPETLVSSAGDVAQYIPQREPIVMVDCLYGVDQDGQKAESGLTVNDDNIFVRDGYFTFGGVIEHMAQTAALKSGYETSLMLEDGSGNPPTGYIGAVKSMKYLNKIPSGSKIVTKLKVINQFQQISVVQAEVTLEDKVMATAQLHIFQIKEE